MPYIGRPLRRVEDPRLLRGAGRFTDDLRLPGMLHVHLVRSPHAHARIVRLDAARARRAPGVVEVVTGDDVRDLGHLGANPIFPAMKVAPHPVLARGVVRAVGEAVAAVVAETACQAQDAAELVEVAWDPLPPLVEPEEALGPGAPALHPELETNRAFTHAWRAGDAAGAFATAARVVRLRVEQQRLAAVALEPRGVLARYDADLDELTVWSSTQAPFRVRADVATSIGIAENRVRAIAPDVGGGFGVKGAPYREEILAAWLALRLRRPVKWIATRAEDFATTKQARAGRATGELAVAADGRILGLRARILYPLGLHLMWSSPVPAWNHARTLPGAYVVPAVDIETAGAYTTTGTTGAYRGAGRPEGIFLIERLMDEAARALGLDPADIRRRNFVPSDAFPYRTPTGAVYDSGDYGAAFEKTLSLAGYRELRQAQTVARERGEIVGVGIASYVEPAALGWESGSVRVERTGAVTVVTGSSPHGQGHETTWAQIVADALGVAPSAVRVQHGDTRGVPQGFGTFGSRSTALGGSAVFRAATAVREKGGRIAARMLEAAPEDIVPVAGGFQVAGVPARGVTWGEVAGAAYRGIHLGPDDDPGLDSTVFFKADGETWSFGTCVATVAIDAATGAVRLTRCVWVDDAGTIVNPLLVEGQLHGSYAQGAGQALLEAVRYDGAGQLVTATLMDYPIPRLGDFPEPILDKTVTPSPHNPLGAKGMGEAGCIAVPPAIVNAVVDALEPWGAPHLDMPITAEKVWRVLRTGRRAGNTLRAFRSRD
ncbi:MAG: xanthine dehydrogenase family protein molybdopterin-binding subunit [Candidatus Rokubacteria bacterium]|nr:xanthine dehydrogenase family protein molybdopterin-binding subunit [Candidatus Rokubacteria bacterium]